MTRPLSRAHSEGFLTSLALDRHRGPPMHGQLAGRLRQLIRERGLVAGVRLPASRRLASDLGVSRSTVTTALEQLQAEGYVEGRRGAGVFVCAHIPDPALKAPPHPRPTAAPPSQRPRPFQPAAPDLDLFPHDDWARMLLRAWRDPAPELVHAGDPMGHLPLRQAIADHVAGARGIAVGPDCVAITSGGAESVSLIVEMLLERGDRVVVEEPGYAQLNQALGRAGAVPVPVAVDGQGLAIPDRYRAAAALVTPSRQYPLGITMPLGRRLELLQWAERRGAFIIEDDYDSEYRYRGSPLPALFSLKPAAPVVYLGSFSKTMSPAMRLAYLIVPEALAARLHRLMAETGPKASIVPQPALAQFMSEGLYGAHIRRTRRAYARRQAVLLAALAETAGGVLRAEAEPAGMHLIATILKPRLSDREAAGRSEAKGITARALSGFYSGNPTRQGLVLGYAGFPEDAIEAGVATLARALT
jgi:GntR family transcriptional regulator/MocR family aminotransferase